MQTKNSDLYLLIIVIVFSIAAGANASIMQLEPITPTCFDEHHLDGVVDIIKPKCVALNVDIAKPDELLQAGALDLSVDISKTMASKNLDLNVSFSHVVGRKALSIKSLTALKELFDIGIEDMNLNTKQIFESKIRLFDRICEINICTNMGRTLFGEEIIGKYALRLLTLAK